MTDMTAHTGTFSVGRSISRAISTFFANFISFNLLGLAVMVPGALVLFAMFGATLASLFFYEPGPGAPPPDFSGLNFSLFGVAWVLLLTLQYFLTAVIVYGALRYLQGNKAGIFACLGQGLRRILPIAIVAILTTILLSIGFLLLVIPGIIIALMICLAIPVLMVENPGIFGSLSRSRELTKGYRWHLLGLFLLAFVITTVVNIVVPMPFGLLGAIDPSLAAVGAIVGLALQLFTTVFMAVVLAVAYHDLRVAKEGVSTDQIAAVFD